ncbi:hypothetical protein AZOA_45460 [Azoarcus sp. Aa7]|nr:hypothetical protein [Azoarcus sp. Aa7]
MPAADTADDKPDAALSSDLERQEELLRANRAYRGKLVRAMEDILNAKDEASKEAASKNSRRLVRESERVRRELGRVSRRITQHVSAQKRPKEDNHE